MIKGKFNINLDAIEGWFKRRDPQFQ